METQARFYSFIRGAGGRQDPLWQKRRGSASSIENTSNVGQDVVIKAPCKGSTYLKRFRNRVERQPGSTSSTKPISPNMKTLKIKD